MTEPSSIFDRIIEVEKTKKLHGFDIDEIVTRLFSCPKLKKERDKEIIRDRFGLSKDKTRTLEEIGRELGVTRERVRQIEKSALKKLDDFAVRDKAIHKALTVIREQIEKSGGAVNYQDYYQIFLGDGPKSNKSKNNLLFLARLNKSVNQISENVLLKKGLAVSKTEKELNNLVKIGSEILDEAKTPLEESVFIAQFKARADKKYQDQEIIAAISLSKQIIRTDEGHLGLTHWREINPKSIRDKTYYVLRKHQRPLHFADISEHISKLEKNQKKVTKQAVHNELIRDERFVLIGRGIYALKEWGYKNGIVAEIIEEVLIKAEGPLHKDEIIIEVKKQRIVKDTTILLNLQKDKFVRVARATYTIKK